ncbi:putative amidase [Nemania sp. NC0429]|nr:putative amidase [Nemania sp. NC0429]
MTLGQPYIQTVASGSLIEDLASAEIKPMLLLQDETIRSFQGDILQYLKHIDGLCDVYNEGFSYTLVVYHSSADSSTNSSARLNKPPRCEVVYTGQSISDNRHLPSGPYFLHGSNIHQAWRLYPDELDAFIFGLIPDDVFEPRRFQPLGILAADGIKKEIAVPSRLYHQASRERPLSGARTGLKDIFRVEGVQTTMMSLSYTELYGPETESADYVKWLLKLGAVIVGKTKMTQFASSDEPTDQWIDFHCPVNPRGDRYQSPSGSSSGAAAALAGYPWLDQSIAGDSAGSIRAPATCNGLYSLRPSLNSTSMTGIVVNSPLFDVVGLFSRTLGNLHDVASHTLELSPAPVHFPTRILYPLDFFPHSNAKHQAMVDDFISALERFLGTNRVEFSIAERWSQCPPEEAKGKSLKEYLPKLSVITSQSAFWAMCRDYYQGFNEFRSKYKATYGKQPYVGPVVRYRWGIGEAVTDDEYHTFTEELRVFRKWFDDNIMSTSDESLSDAVMLMPYGSANPKYRDAPNEAPSSTHTIGEKFISPVLGMPQLMPYHSRVSGELEHRPIATTLVGAKDKHTHPLNDLMLINLAMAVFKKESWPTSISTGRYMYEVGDNVRNVALHIST